MIFYKYEDAKNAVKKLGISSFNEYKKRYKEDAKLHSNPNKFYKDIWDSKGNWNGYLSKLVEKYITFEDASKAVQDLDIRTTRELERRYKEDIKLPRAPSKYYPDWHAKGGAYVFFGTAKFKPYVNIIEAMESTQSLQIKNLSEYLKNYKQDPRLPYRPDKAYQEEFKSIGGWDVFFGRTLKYETFFEASEAVKKLGIKSTKEYVKRKNEDPRLPWQPRIQYAKEWNKLGPNEFFGKKIVYKTYEEAAKATISLGISGHADYAIRYKEDIRLPSNPWDLYKDEWKIKGANGYFCGENGREREIVEFYNCLSEASEAAQSLGIINKTEYTKKYSLDKRLPCNPSHIYKYQYDGEFDWDKFLMPTKIDSIAKLKTVVRYLKVKSEKEYGIKYRLYPFAKLRRHPERSLHLSCIKWPGWSYIFDISFYPYDELKNIVINKNIKLQKEYIDFRIASGDPRIPANPEEHYMEWVNWFIFTGRCEPYRTKFIDSKYHSWKVDIEEFLDVTPGGGHKHTSLCRFLREFVVLNDLGCSVNDFLENHAPIKIDHNKDKFLQDKYEEYLISNFSMDDIKQKYKNNQAVVEFIDYIIDNRYLVDNDSDVIQLVRNPFKLKRVLAPISNTVYGETNKNILPYHYIKDAREWMIPYSANAFSDLEHLYRRFHADWYKVDESVIDLNDPDCVWKTKEDSRGVKHFYLWFPLKWIHTYALLQTPFRGVQIAFNDSGEADSYIPELNRLKKIEWIANPSKMAGLTKNQGFIRRYPNDEIGSYCTTNKTSNKEGGYSVPWMDEELAKWIIRARNWQSKYNPLSKPTSWTEIIEGRSNLNKKQKKQKGSNCFLFRAFGESTPPNFGNYLASRLAVALFNIQDKTIPLAQLNATHSESLRNYQSMYTPHSIRASLITAYLMDFGLDIHVVMKLVGHASILMTAYYNKPGTERLRDAIGVGEKKALRDRSYRDMRLIQQGKIESIKNSLTANADTVLSSLNNYLPAANYSFTDCGFCPFAGARCHEGGEQIENSKIYAPVPEGYLGMQNCPRCRFFVTGPAFLGGLLSLANEILLQIKKQSEHNQKISFILIEIKNKLYELDKVEYDEGGLVNSSFDYEERFILENKKGKVNSELERATKKLDAFLCDIQSLNKLIRQCVSIVNSDLTSGSDDNSIKLIKSDKFEVSIFPEETGYFHQLCEVCENSEIFDSANASLAISPRSQLLDQMAFHNGIELRMYMLDERQQLYIGNQMAELLLSRLKTWSRVDDLIEGRLALIDLSDEEAIKPSELKYLVDLKERGYFDRALVE